MMEATQQKQQNRPHHPLIRWGLLLYSLLALAASVIYIVFNHTYYAIDWNRYNSDGNYYLWVKKIMQYGVLRLNGSLLALHSPFLIAFLLAGAGLSLSIFIYARRTFYARTYFPLVALLGYLIPFFPPYDSNVLIRLVLGYFVVLAGAGLSTAALKLV